MKTIAIIANQAFSLVNFRGPLIQSLSSAGVRVFALAPDYDDEIRQQVVQLGAEPVDYSMLRTSINPLRDIWDLLQLTILLRKLRPAITLGYFIKPVIYGTLAAWLAGVPRRIAMIEGLGFVFTNSGDIVSFKRRALRWGVSLMYRIALRKANRVVFLNIDDLQQFLGSRLVNVNQAICLGGIGVDLSEWIVAAPVTEPVTFLLAARLLREKGVVEYVEAARMVRRTYPKVRFILLGAIDSNPGSLSHSELNSWVLEGVIEWPGYVKVRPWLERTSVFVLPSYREGVPRSTQEAMAMARPVITTDSPGCRETVIDGENGFLVPVRNSQALAEKMITLIENTSLIETMGLASRRIAEDRFDVHRINKKMLEILGVES